MIKVKVLNREEEFIKSIEVFNLDYCWKMNGEHSITFNCYEDVIQEGYRILYKTRYHQWREFIVSEPVVEHTLDDLVYEVYAEDSFYETLGDFVMDVRPQGVTAQYALERALETSRWDVGRVEGLGNGSTNFYRESVKSAVHKIIEAWGAEFDTRIEVSGSEIKRYVDLYKQMGTYHGKRFVYNKDLLGVKRTVNMDGFCTALYGFGKGEELETGGYGRRIDFSEINNGKAYVENNEARLKYGRKDGDGKAHIFDKVEFDDITDKTELLALTKKELEQRSKPNVSYECNTINLPWDFEQVNRGDTVIVLDKDIDLTVQARVIEYHEYDEEEQIVLGDYQPIISDTLNKTEKYINDFRSKSGVWDKSDILDEDGINSDVLKDLIPKLNEEMNQRGGWVTISDKGEGIMTVDDPVNPTMAIQILGGSFRIANSKFADGSWNWRTFGDGNGFVADYIKTGTLLANLIKAGILSDRKGKFFLNMETGALNFGDKIKYNPTTNKFEIDGSLIVSEINGSYSRIDGSNLTLNGNTRVNGDFSVSGRNITLDGNTSVTGSFQVPSSAIFGSIKADSIETNTIRAEHIYNRQLNNVGLNNSTFSTSRYGDTRISGSGVNMGANSSYISLRDTGGRGEMLINGTVGARGSNYYLEFNAGGLYLNKSGSAKLQERSGNLQLTTSTLYVNSREIVFNSDGSVSWR